MVYFSASLLLYLRGQYDWKEGDGQVNHLEIKV